MAKSGIAWFVTCDLWDLADLALYQGQFHDAEVLLTKGIVEDQARGQYVGPGGKERRAGRELLGEGKGRLAVEAARRTLKLLGTGPASVPAARVLIAAGATEEPRALAPALADNLQPELELTPGRSKGKSPCASGGTWRHPRLFGPPGPGGPLVGPSRAGIAYVEAGHPAEALGELEQCRKRQGEATAILFDDLPSIRYLAPLPVLAGPRAGGVGQTASARTSYSEFLRIRSADAPGPIRWSRTRDGGSRRSAHRTSALRGNFVGVF